MVKSVYELEARSLKEVTCPSATPGGWDVDPMSPLPTMGQTLSRSSDESASATGTAAAVPSESKKSAGVVIARGMGLFRMGGMGLLGVVLCVWLDWVVLR